MVQTIYIDNKPYEVKAGKNLLEACLALGFDLPYFCWHPALGSVGACRQCAVKIFKDEKDMNGRLIMSCMEPVKDGLRLSIDDAAAKDFREQVIGWLMTNHPHDCPVCDEGGSCHLQDMTVMTGHDYRSYHYKKRTYRNQYLGPLIHHEMNRCIQCYRCVRYYHDYAGGDDLNVFAAHNHVYFGREKDGVLQSPFSGNLAEVCPTGVFTDKTLKEHYTRKWDLTMAPSVCQHCSVGCNIIAGERYGKLRCVVNRYNGEVNGYFLCDRGRFGYEFVNSENRVRQPVIRNRMGEAVTETELMHYLTPVLMQQKLIGIGSAKASVESNFALRQLVGEDNFYSGVSEQENYLSRRVASILQQSVVHSASLKDIERSDAILILGEDIWNTAPMMALAVRQSVKKSLAANAAQSTSLPVWHDAAVKELLQEQKGFLANITVAGSKLDDIATHTLYAAPDDIARFGFAVAHQLNNTLSEIDLTDSVMRDKAHAVAETLRNAKHPVIISGISSYNDGIIKAAFNIASSLNNEQVQAGIGYVVPECNSLGLALMQASSFEKAAEWLRKEKDVTAVILENDLYRNISPALVDDFFANCKNIIVLDSLNNATTEKAGILIPAATFAEGDGTWINYEGRAQRFYQVFVPKEPAVKESWKWLCKMRIAKMQLSNGHDPYPEELLQQLETILPQFHGITNVSPKHDYTFHGERIPREPHRYSGRTAMQANLSVSEPKPLGDDDSPLSFTMEGYKGIPPSGMTPFFWSPGWNSVQSVTKFQKEPGGALRDGDPGIQLFTERTSEPAMFFKDIPEAFVQRQQKWLVLPQYDVLGSGELSGYTSAINELSPEPFIAVSAKDARDMNIEQGLAVKVMIDKDEYVLPVKIMQELPGGILLISAGLRGSSGVNWGAWGKVMNAE